VNRIERPRLVSLVARANIKESKSGGPKCEELMSHNQSRGFRVVMAFLCFHAAKTTAGTNPKP
jgi:hypothetical protein